LFFYSGLVKYAQGSYHEAAALLENASSLNPNDSATWFNLGMSYEQIRKFDLAVKAYDNAIDIDPKYGKPWFFKGRIFESFGNKSLAIMAFENYTALAPEDDLGWFFYAKSLHDDGRNNESIQALQRAVNINPSKQIYKEFLGVYESTNQSTPDELIFGRPSDHLTLLILVIIFIIGGCAIYRR